MHQENEMCHMPHLGNCDLVYKRLRTSLPRFHAG